jgi:hypothetical protein
MSVSIEIVVQRRMATDVQLSLELECTDQLVEYLLRSSYCVDAFDVDDNDFRLSTGRLSDLTIVQGYFESEAIFDEWFSVALPTHSVELEAVEPDESEFVEEFHAAGVAELSRREGPNGNPLVTYIADYATLCWLVHDYWGDSSLLADIEQLKR